MMQTIRFHNINYNWVVGLHTTNTDQFLIQATIETFLGLSCKCGNIRSNKWVGKFFISVKNQMCVIYVCSINKNYEVFFNKTKVKN